MEESINCVPLKSLTGMAWVRLMLSSVSWSNSILSFRHLSFITEMAIIIGITKLNMNSKINTSIPAKTLYITVKPKHTSNCKHLDSSLPWFSLICFTINLEVQTTGTQIFKKHILWAQLSHKMQTCKTYSMLKVVSVGFGKIRMPCLKFN